MASVQQSKKEKNEEKGEEVMTRLKKKKPDDPNKELNLRQNPLLQQPSSSLMQLSNASNGILHIIHSKANPAIPPNE